MIRREFVKGSAILGMTAASYPMIGKHSGLVSERSARKLHSILDSERISVGTLPVLRAFAGNHVDMVSPYLLLDEFGPEYVKAGADPLRVDAHPHAGVTPTTYFLEGTGHHKDSLNYDFQIGKGDFMLFSSGSGAIHMEESGLKLYEEGGNYHGFQIWLNTPKEYKWDAPLTIVHRESQMDIIEHQDYNIKVVLGQLGDARSSIEVKSPAFYYHVKMKKEGRLDIPTDPNHNAFIYMIKGNLELIGQTHVKTHQLALYQRGGDHINVCAQSDSDFLVLGGKPLNEPVFSYGPFVMNTEDEIRRCIHNYNSGKMGNPDLVNG